MPMMAMSSVASVTESPLRNSSGDRSVVRCYGIARPPSVRFPFDDTAARAGQEVEIAAPVGLQYVIDVQSIVAALVLRRRDIFLPRRDAGLEFLGRDQELEPPLRAVEQDLIAILDHGERPAGRR